MLTRRDMLRLVVTFGVLGHAERVFGQSPKRIRVVGFAGASNVPLWVGQERGFFAQQGVEAVFEITPNSDEMVRNLYEGRFDLAFSSIDNVVAYDEGQGEAGLAEADVVFSKVGGGAHRLQALLRGEQTATLLNAPMDGMAVSKGFVRLTTARSAIGPLQGGVGMTRRDAAARMRDELEAF